MYKGKRIRRKRRCYVARDELVTLIMCHLAIVLGFTIIALVVQMERADRRVEQSVTQPAYDRVSTDSVEYDDGRYDVEASSPYDVPYDDEGRPYPTITWSKDWDAEDDYYLAKIVECEAGICDMRTKIRHALVVLNRVHSSKFPDSIYDVITQNRNGVYQFSPVMPGGSWYDTEPTESAYEAIEHVKIMRYDISHGATYFEATGSCSVWHQKALTEVLESDGVRFYVEKQ